MTKKFKSGHVSDLFTKEELPNQTERPFNLSELATFLKVSKYPTKRYYKEKDVKEFIRLLKEFAKSNRGMLPIGFINKLAGEELLK